MVSLGQEVLAPFVRPDGAGESEFRLPGRTGQPLPYLCYAPGAYLGRMVDLILKQSSTAIHLDRVYETDMAEGLKAMALEGHGIAFLPLSAVKKELRAKKLVSAGAGLEMTMDIRVYREHRTSQETAKTHAQALWSYLLSQTNPAPVSKTRQQAGAVFKS